MNQQKLTELDKKKPEDKQGIDLVLNVQLKQNLNVQLKQNATSGTGKNELVPSHTSSIITSDYYGQFVG